MDRVMGLLKYIKNKLLKRKKDYISILGNQELKAAIVLVAVATKHSGYYALIPNNLDIDNHILRYPLTNYNFTEIDGKIYTVNKRNKIGSCFDKERMLYVLDLLNIIPARYKDSVTEDGFVSINSAIVRNYFKDYLSYIEYLIDTNILVSDNHYEVGEKSIGYKYAPLYESADLVEVYYSRFDINEIQPIHEEVYNKTNNCFQPNILLNHPYLTHWYNQKALNIDTVKATKYAYLLMRKKFALGYDNWDVNRDKWSKKRNDFCKKFPRTQYKAIRHNICSIKIHDYKAKIDTNVYRLHSVITNMEKDYRNFLTYNGNQLVSIDISNSQPYLMNILFNPEFWKENSTLPLSIYNLPTNIQSLITPSLSIMIGNYLEELDINSLEEYKLKTSEGSIYENIMRIVRERFVENLTRKQIKTMFYIVLFSNNKFFNQPEARLKKLFSEIYPQVYKLVYIIKIQNHPTLACLLQAIESEIILHRCCKRIWEEGNQQIPIFTIHDSIVTTIEYEEFVKNIMQEELRNVIGVPSHLEAEILREEGLKHQDILTQINQTIN
ncbi:hypothetical protein IR083_09710 [Dysgonomonas sp. GY75]|uniref:hypothetical protein n=1 Tax=Dysgonomonas sp. GY75 TaxID=2780419 RepID=UPI0018841F98|nr:hypothetical protein [Dysgonomonas sp. GY75]MBF0649095.1 hypothetical protein [Dysgonomonas sp. GY75]